MNRRVDPGALTVLALCAVLAAIVVSGASAAPGIAPRQVCEPRPITPIGESFFEDISVPAGIKAAEPPDTIAVHPRAAVADIDGDGFDDLIAHNHQGHVRGAAGRYEHVVYRNNGDGTFTDVSVESGLADVQAAFFVFGDVDNDGDQDVFGGLDITDHPDTAGNYTHQLLLNDGAGHFTARLDSGVEVPPGRSFTAGNAVFADFDGDANLDLFVGNGHTGYLATDNLYMGRGDGRFMYSSARLLGNSGSPSNGATACDFDSDGDIDIFVAVYGVSNGGAQNFLYINDGNAVFEDMAVERGVASLPGGNYWRADLGYGRDPEPGGAPGTYIGGNGFGVDCVDINRDGHMDILMADISHPTEFPPGFRGWPQDEIDRANYTRRWSDPSQILVNQGPEGDWKFVNEWLDRGLPFNEGDIDAAAADIDNDGRPDIAMSRDKKYEANYSTIDQLGWLGLFHQAADGTFTSVGYTSGINHTEDAAGAQRMRGSGNINWADIDHDGDLDLFLGGGPKTTTGHLFSNQIGSQNDWLAVRLEGDGEAVNRDAIGARVKITHDTVVQTRDKKAGRGTFNSMDTRVLHFGLGEMSCDYDMTVRWPDGTVHVFDGAVVGRNRYVTVNNAGELTFSPDEPPVTPVPTDVPPTPLPTATPTETPVPTVTPTPEPPAGVFLPLLTRVHDLDEMP